MSQEKIVFKGEKNRWSERESPEPAYVAIVLQHMQAHAGKYNTGCLARNIAIGVGLPDSTVDKILASLLAQGFLMPPVAGKIDTGGTMGLFWKVAPDVTVKLDVLIERPDPDVPKPEVDPAQSTTST